MSLGWVELSVVVALAGCAANGGMNDGESGSPDAGVGETTDPLELCQRGPAALFDGDLVVDMTLDGKELFLVSANSSSNAVVRVDLDARSALTLVTATGANITRLAVGANDVVFQSKSPDSLSRVAKAGGTPEVLVEAPVLQFAVDGDDLYYSTELGGGQMQLWRRPLAAPSARLVAEVPYGRWLVGDGGVYVTSEGDSMLSHVGLDGSTRELLRFDDPAFGAGAGIHRPVVDLASDESSVYLTMADHPGGMVLRVPKDGSPARNLVPSLGTRELRIGAVHVDSTHVYWIEGVESHGGYHPNPDPTLAARIAKTGGARELVATFADGGGFDLDEACLYHNAGGRVFALQQHPIP